MKFFRWYATCGKNCRYDEQLPAKNSFVKVLVTTFDFVFHRLCGIEMDRQSYVWLRVAFEGTKLWNTTLVHFAVGDLGKHHAIRVIDSALWIGDEVHC